MEGAAARCGGGGRAAQLTWSRQAADRSQPDIAPACLRQKTHRQAVLCAAAAGPKLCALPGRLSVVWALDTAISRQQEQPQQAETLPAAASGARHVGLPCRLLREPWVAVAARGHCLEGFSEPRSPSSPPAQPPPLSRRPPSPAAARGSHEPPARPHPWFWLRQ